MAERAQVIVEEYEEAEPTAPVLQAVPDSAPLAVRQPGPHHHRPREVAVLIVLSAVLHGGAAYGFLTQEKPAPVVRQQKVEIEFHRPAQPAVIPPPPPPPPAVQERVKPTARPEAAPTPVAEPTPTEQPQATSDAPVDTGSSAEAAPDGNLVAGNGGSGLAPALPQAPPKPAPPAAIVQAREGANYSKNPRPSYPGRAKREGWEGQVLLRVQVQPNGRPGTIKVQKSSGRGILDEAAQAAVKDWTFVPATQGGVPVAGWVTVPLVFRLQ